MRHWRSRSFHQDDRLSAAHLRGPSRSRLEMRRRRARFFLYLTARNVQLAVLFLSAVMISVAEWLLNRTLHGKAAAVRRSFEGRSDAERGDAPIGLTVTGTTASDRKKVGSHGLARKGGANRTTRRRQRRTGHLIVDVGGSGRIPDENDPYPPLDDLIDRSDPKHQHLRPDVNASFLLDFAVIGFAKTGTTALMRYLSSFADVLAGERCDLVVDDTAQLVHSLYNELPRRPRDGFNSARSSSGRPRGLKCPQDLSSEGSLPNYARHFPSTKLIVGVRHPLFFFESLYNFRVMTQHWRAADLLPPNNLTRRCVAGSLGVCGWRAEFADFLAKLGKTPRGPTEEELLRLHLPGVDPPGVGEVFLYEMGQLSDNDEDDEDPGGRAAAFRRDLGTFLGVDAATVERAGPVHRVSLDQLLSEDVPREARGRKIDICDEEHWIIKTVLIDKARRTSVWLRDYFIKAEGVTVSSREHLVRTLEGWMKDPCPGRK